MTNPLIPRLYKYLPCNDNTYNSLSLPGFWCGSTVDMNDPFECMLFHNQSFSEDENKYFRKNFSPFEERPLSREFNDMSNSEIQKMVKEFRDNKIKKMNFCALSEKPLNILMWSHYANGHRGCVIGIDGADIKDVNLEKIQYLDAPPPIDLKHFSDLHSFQTDNIQPTIKNYSCKAPDWEYEEEWRIWGRVSGNIPIDKSLIKEVIFGVRASYETKRTVAKLLKLKDDFQYEKAIVQYDPPRLEKSTTDWNWGLEALSMEEVC